jgi:hypothetical protein
VTYTEAEEHVMETIDQDLAGRLAALEAAIPAPAGPPVLPGRGRRGRFAVSLALAPVVVLAVVATATAGAIAVASLAHGHPGIQNDGQPLAGVHMECMSPPEAAAVLAAHGFTNVTWQVESGVSSVGGAKGQTSTVQQSVPPEHGYVVPGSLLDDGTVIMVVDQRADASAGGACPDLPMP